MSADAWARHWNMVLPDAADVGAYSYCSAADLAPNTTLNLRGAIAVFEGDDLRALVFGPTAKLDAQFLMIGLCEEES